MIKVGVLGARVRMGRTVCETIEGTRDTELGAQVDQGDDRAALLGSDVVVDFTHVGAVMDNLHWCIEHGLNVVGGTSGFDDARLAQVRSWLGESPESRALIVPNFSVGAVLMMRFAAQAARFFESAEIIELHHANKMDAPSGTALRTASMIGAARTSAGLGASPDATKEAAALYRDDFPEDNPFGIPDAVDALIGLVISEGGDVEFVDEGILQEYGRIALIRYY